MMRKDIEEILKTIIVEDVYIASTEVPYYANQLLDLFQKYIPKKVDEDGSSGKWVNGWNDCIDYIQANMEDKI